MKKYCHLFGIVLLVGVLALVLSSCNETMTNQIDRVTDTGDDPPVEEPETPSAEEPMEPSTEEPTTPTPKPLAPLPRRHRRLCGTATANVPSCRAATES